MSANSTVPNWYNEDSHPSIEIATLCGDLYFDRIDNVVGNFIVQVLTPEEPIVDEKVKNIMKAPKVKNIATINAKLESKNYIASNAVALTIPSYLLPIFTLDPKDKEDGIYVIPSGTKFVVSVIGGEATTDDMRILAVYSDGLNNLGTTGTRTAANNHAGANNTPSYSPGRGTRTSKSNR